MWTSIRNFLMQSKVVMGAYVLVTIVASLHLYIISKHVDIAPPYTDYNNYVIFKLSFFHLLQGKNLYIHHLTEQWDLYKYSPTFALAMGLLAKIPDYIAMPAWNLLNAMALYAAVRKLPFTTRNQTLMLWFILLELLTSLQNTQSNGLMAALMIGTYNSLQSGKAWKAALWVALAAFIKIYAVIVVCLFIFYPDKMKFIGWGMVWTILLAVLPLVVISPDMLIWQYHNWVVMMGQDEAVSYGMSVLGWLHTWFGLNGGKSVVTIIGALLFFVPFARISMYKNETFRLLMLAFMLIWVIIFNHKAESPTYILVLTGVGIWYFSRPRTSIHKALMLFVFVVSCLTPTDLFPHDFRHNFLEVYFIKAVPAIVMWVILWVEVMTLKSNETEQETILAVI